MLLWSFDVILFCLHANHSQKRSQPSDRLRPAANAMRMTGGKEVIQPHLDVCWLLSGTSWLVSGSQVKKRHLSFRNTDDILGKTHTNHFAILLLL